MSIIDKIADMQEPLATQEKQYEYRVTRNKGILITNNGVTTKKKRGSKFVGTEREIIIPVGDDVVRIKWDDFAQKYFKRSER